jgi:hypothetical protein
VFFYFFHPTNTRSKQHTQPPKPKTSVGDYQKTGPMAGLEGALHTFQLDADF